MGDDPMALLGLEGALKHYYYYYYYYYITLWNGNTFVTLLDGVLAEVLNVRMPACT
jgi:hypothetical protein